MHAIVTQNQKPQKKNGEQERNSWEKVLAVAVWEGKLGNRAVNKGDHSLAAHTHL